MILYTDKTEIFECNVDVEGALLENTKARLIIESKKWNLVFYGDINNNGKCKIDISNLDIFKEGESGKMRLEIIADNTVFVPWKDDFNIKINKKVTVEVVNKNNTNTLSESMSKKVVVNVQAQKKETAPVQISKTNSEQKVLKEMLNNLKENSITIGNAKKNKSLLMNVIFNTMDKNNIDREKSMSWLSENITGLIEKLDK